MVNNLHCSDEFPEYSPHWARGEDGSDLEKPFLTAPIAKDDCYGLDENARAAEVPSLHIFWDKSVLRRMMCGLDSS